MQKIFSIIGIAAIAILTVYFCIITPINAFSELKAEKRKYEKLYNESIKDNARIYEAYNNALKYHLSADKIDEIYSDARFFNKIDTEISVTDTDKTTAYISYR